MLFTPMSVVMFVRVNFMVAVVVINFCFPFLKDIMDSGSGLRPRFESIESDCPFLVMQSPWSIIPSKNGINRVVEASDGFRFSRIFALFKALSLLFLKHQWRLVQRRVDGLLVAGCRASHHPMLKLKFKDSDEFVEVSPERVRFRIRR